MQIEILSCCVNDRGQVFSEGDVIMWPDAADAKRMIERGVAKAVKQTEAKRA